MHSRDGGALSRRSWQRMIRNTIITYSRCCNIGFKWVSIGPKGVPFWDMRAENDHSSMAEHDNNTMNTYRRCYNIGFDWVSI